MKHLYYFVWLFVFILSLFFYNEYFVLHTYYYSFLLDLWNWVFIIFAILSALIPAFYFVLKTNKTWKWILLSFWMWFALFSLFYWLHNGWFINLWYFIYLLNFFILFVFFTVIILCLTALWDLILQKVNFKEAIYNYAIKTWVWISVLWIILYFLNILWFANIVFSYIVLFWLILIVFYRKDNLNDLFYELLLSVKKFTLDIKNINIYKNVQLKYVFYAIFVLVFLYIYFWFSYSFIPYPSAWDANHAYMFYPRVFAEYGGYPWHTDFRPGLTIWSALLTWVYNLWFFTWFSQDTWMITFNFTSWIFSLFFGFMLINTIVQLIYNKKDIKHYLLLILWYVLIIAWLTSWMWAFLVFVDNKTDLAVLMFVILGLFLAIYSLFRQKQDENIKYNEETNKLYNKLYNKANDNDKEIYVFFALSWFFFAIANIIKPTATFDFFETSIVFSILNIWVLAVIWWLLFVIWLLYYLKFRGFDKLFNWLWNEISNFLWKWAMLTWLSLWLTSLSIKIRENKTKIISFSLFIFSFIFTVVFTKSAFWIAQYIYDGNIDSNPWKIATAYIMSNKFPTLQKNQLTWDLYKWLTEWTWSSYNEDNGRYVWYWNRNFYNPWWSFVVPSSFKTWYIIYFNEKEYQSSTWDKIYLFDRNNKKDVINNIKQKVIYQYVLEIFNNKDNYLYKEQIQAVVSNAKKNWQLLNLAKQLWLNIKEDTPKWKIEKSVLSKLKENIKKQLLNQIKLRFFSWDLNLSSYPKVIQTEENKNIFKTFKDRKDSFVVVSIPYKYLVPFNVTFNRSLQNPSSYYTDIGIIWLLLFIITIFAFIYSFFIKDKVLWAFSFATLVWWFIWYGIASWIVWYDIGWIVWLIITTILFVNRLKDDLFLVYVLLFISSIGIWLNLFRITIQWWGEVQLWYKSSIWKVKDYKLKQGWIIPNDKLKIPYTADDLFSLQFNFYKKAIKYFDNRKKDEAWIIWWTYMRYFIKNQNRIINDQFLTYLYKLFSDDDVKKSYARLKDQKITWIVIDPNIASVVMWTWNKSLWYRYYGYTDKNWNVTKKWVLPMFVDLAQSWEIEYTYSSNLGIKYALTIPDETITKVLWIKDKKDILQLRYKLTSIKFLSRMLWFQAYNQALDAFYKLLLYRAKNQPIKFIEDVAEANWLNIKDGAYLLNNVNNFNSWEKDEKLAFLRFNYIVTWLKQNPSKAQQILTPLIRQWIWWRAQLLFIKVK